MKTKTQTPSAPPAEYFSIEDGFQQLKPPGGAESIHLPARVMQNPNDWKDWIFTVMSHTLLDALKETAKINDTRVDHMLIYFTPKEFIYGGLLVELLTAMGAGLQVTFTPSVGKAERWIYDGVELSYATSKTIFSFHTYEDLDRRYEGDLKKINLKKAFVLDFTPAPERVEVDKWVTKAVRKKDKRVDMEDWTLYSWGKFATDHYRIHYNSSIPLIKHTAEELTPSTIVAVEDMLVAFRNLKNTITSYQDPLMKAVQQAKGHNSECIHLTMKAKGMEVSALKMKDVGKRKIKANAGKSVIKYQTTNQAEDGLLEILINPKFLLDALSGMTAKDAVTIKYNHERMYLTDGEREVCVMMMRKG